MTEQTPQMDKIAELFDKGYRPNSAVQEAELARNPDFTSFIAYMTKPDGDGVVQVDEGGNVTDYLSETAKLLGDKRSAFIDFLAENVRADLMKDQDRLTKAWEIAQAEGITEEFLDQVDESIPDYASFSAVFGAHAFSEDLQLIMQYLDAVQMGAGYSPQYQKFYPQPQ